VVNSQPYFRLENSSMFDFIRQHQRWMQGILILLILPSFAFFGVQSYTSFMNREPELATVDGNGITLSEFNRARKAQLDQYQAVLGNQFDPAALDTAEMRKQVLNNVIDQKTVALAAEKGRFTVSDETLRRTIASIPAVQQDGQFSPERYRQILASQGMTPTGFENSLRRDLALAQVLTPVSSSVLVPDAVVQKFAALLGEKRVVAVQSFNADSYQKSVKVTPEQINAWYESNQASLKIPESVDIEYLLINESAASKDITVSDADVDTFYKQNQARYSQPERRRVNHILIEVGADATPEAKTKARDLAADLTKQANAQPKDFSDLAKKFSQDTGSKDSGGDLGWITKGMLVPQVESEIFTLEKGKISGPVESPFGYHVIYVADIQPVTVKPLGEVKADIVSEIRKQIAADRFATLSDKLTKLIYDQRDGLKPVADALGLPLLTAQGLARTGLLPVSQGGSKLDESSTEAVVLNNPKVAQTAFSADVFKSRLNSGVITLSPDTMLALRVSKINETRVPPLKDVSEVIRDRLAVQQATELAKAAANARVEELKSDHSATKLKGFDAPMTISRQNRGSLTKEQVDTVMILDAKVLPQFVAIPATAGYDVFELSKVEAAPEPEPGQLTQLRQELAQALGGAEERAALAVLRQTYKVEMLPAAAKVISGELDEQK